VNADDPEAVHRVSKLAVEYRQKFKKDIIIDLVAYRRFGHNEVDEPEFTQPLMYKIIRSPKGTSPKLYHERLVEEGLVKPEDYTKLREKVFSFLEKEFEESSKVKRTLEDYKNPNSKGSKTLTGKWKHMDYSVLGKSQATGEQKPNFFVKISQFYFYLS
jgi:2-oxoglutarate dehydrogenase complex dehydrogenase (E1) component-like enzyme